MRHNGSMDSERTTREPEAAPPSDGAADHSQRDQDSTGDAETETREIIERYRETFDELAK
ncbi:hypothetical protein BH20ACT19_BH20ACT19_13530 [soil metagenome]